ncbi:MAG TPA: histidine kinase dimerization/phosphoacceptor domain -containing protein [Balneolaceae bacterium]
MLTYGDVKSNPAENRFKIDVKLIGVLSVFALTGIILLLVVIVAANTISALRSYATLHTHWTGARKEAVIELERFIYTGDQRFFNQFKDKIEILDNAEKARVEIISEQPDLQKVTRLFAPFQFADSEVQDMITTYERVGFMPEFASAIAIWKKAGRIVGRLDSLGNVINESGTSKETASSAKAKWIQKTGAIDSRINELQYGLAAVLARGTERLQNVIFWTSTGIGFILFFIGCLMASRFLKSLHRWEYALNLNKQRYQSLFDHNPDAVCSFNKNGEFLEGNKALHELLGTSGKEIKGTNSVQFIHPSDRERVRGFFEKAAGGEPQTYETLGIDTEGEKIHIQITNLPIYAAGEIVGVYGIIQDINDRVIAEQKVQKQLNEKTVLLEEIHHRVKNNLALISGLLMLQEEKVENEEVLMQLKESQNRIFSLAEVHEILYDTEDFSELPIERYARSIMDRICNSLLNGKQIEHHVRGDGVCLDINKAIPFGLITNELITNSCKHAFDFKEKGFIQLNAKANCETVSVSYMDDGKGLPPDFSFEEAAQTSLGMQLIYTLLKQLGADYNLELGTENFRLDFTFKV